MAIDDFNMAEVRAAIAGRGAGGGTGTGGGVGTGVGGVNFDSRGAASAGQPVTLAEAKALGFNSTEGITKKDGMYYFAESLAPGRKGFQPVGVAKPGEVQMTPYYGDVTGAYRLTQEQYAKARSMGGDVTANILQMMFQNEVDALVKSGLSLEEATAKVNESFYGKGAGIGDGGGTSGDGTGTSDGFTPEQEKTAFDAALQGLTPAEADQRRRQTEDTIAVLTSRFSQFGLESLVPTIKRLAIQGATEATVTLELQNTAEYKQRFRANQARIAKGLSVLNPADYIGLEDTYRQVLRSYGLAQFDNDAYVQQFIANDVSPSEVSTRIATASQRVKNADPATMTILKRYYNLNENDVIAYILSPEEQLPRIERQIAAAEIGLTAARQGFNVGAATAEQLAAQGITQEEAKRGYATIAEILPTAQKLSDIYGDQLGQYGITEAEQEVFNSLASAQRKRQTLAQREVAAFSGTSGLTRTSLSSKSSGGQFQNPVRTCRPRQCIRPIVGAMLLPRIDMRPATNYEQKGGTLL